MKVSELIEKSGFEICSFDASTDRMISSVYCCDFLSFAMGKAPEGCAWVTVMSNVNTLAVAQLADVACVVLAEGAVPDENTLQRASLQEIPLLRTDLPVFEAALTIHNLLRV